MPPGTALITGASEGIGHATALAFGAAGYSVGLVARNAARLDERVAELGARGVKAIAASADVADPGQVAAAVAKITAALGPVDVLVNNAGLLISKPFVDTSLDDFDRMFATNVRSIYLVTQAVLPSMLARGAGVIVNIASLAGKNGVANAAAYSATKHAVLGLSRSLMLEVRKRGVRVIAICPGSVATAMIQEFGSAPPVERMLQPEDVAAAVVAAVHQPSRATVSELDIRPSNP